jgi:hypothetical protein
MLPLTAPEAFFGIVQLHPDTDPAAVAPTSPRSGRTRRGRVLRGDAEDDGVLVAWRRPVGAILEVADA